jgi:hypothetical protein
VEAARVVPHTEFLIDLDVGVTGILMKCSPSNCPCHPDERRDERFAVLDALIEAGWGSVPMYLVEIEIQRNGGILPTRPPVGLATSNR